jgi:hypothetical protein
MTDPALPENFQDNGLGWQLQQLRRRIGEWIEVQFSFPEWDGIDGPDPVTLPEWITQAAFWIITTLLLIWVLRQLVIGLRPYAQQWQMPWDRRDRTSPSSSSDLPASHWLQQALRYQQQGNYAEACRALYLATLQQLHEAQTIPQQHSRTDGEYLKLVNQLPQPRPYQLLIRTHERLCFSRTPITGEIWQRCRRAYEEITK